MSASSRRTISPVLVTAVLAAVVLSVASCATINRLDPYELQGSRLAARMRTPPEPRVHVAYDVTLTSHNPIFSALSVMTNLAKAAQADKADLAMRQALDTVDIPAMVMADSFAGCADAIGASQVDDPQASDFYLDMDIRDWGIEADSPGSAVSLHVEMNVRLVRTLGRETIWERTLSVNQPASPSWFGLGQIVGNMVTATALYEMTPEDLATGFKEMARETSRYLVNLLRRDLDRARYGG